MSAVDKARHAADEAMGKLKEATGRLTNDSQVERKGKHEQAQADLRQAGEHVKDAMHE